MGNHEVQLGSPRKLSSQIKTSERVQQILNNMPNYTNSQVWQEMLNKKAQKNNQDYDPIKYETSHLSRNANQTSIDVGPLNLATPTMKRKQGQSLMAETRHENMTQMQFTKQQLKIQASTTGFFPAVSSAAQKTQSNNDDIYKVTEATMSTSARKTGEVATFGRTSAFQDNNKTAREANLGTRGITSSLGNSDEGETEVKCTTGMTFAKRMEEPIKVPGKKEKNQFFNRTFTKFNQIKRRNPNKYMHNPAKAHFTTLGSHDYVYEDTYKEDSKIRTHSNELRKLRHDYKSLLPGAPYMSVDKETVK